jgi:DNA polymerase epsilon subunit 2
LQSIGVADIFGNGYRPQQLQHYAELESEAADAMIIIVSDIQIEKTSVFDKLKQLFQGFEDSDATSTPPLFVLMGNFVTKSATVSNGREAVESSFRLLADAIAASPRIARDAKFIIVPGNRDPGLNTLLPRRAIPELFTTELKKRVSHINFTSNPSRIRFFTQEIVFFREDLLRKLQRHMVREPKPATATLTGLQQDDEVSTKAADVTEQLVLSILDQAHLWPLPAHVKPIVWDLDYTLRITPLPHLLVLGDQVDQFSYDYCGCKVVNPGSFASDYSFVVYRPATRAVEFSRIPA